MDDRDGSSRLYFAYGSNADPERFRARVGRWRSRRLAWLDGYRLRFAGSVQSEGGGGAVVDPCPGERVAGVLYEITDAQLAELDDEEFRSDRDTAGLGRRRKVVVGTPDGPRDAEMYTVDDDGAWRAPSERYLRHIVDGLADAGHPREVLDGVRAAAQGAGAR